MKNELEGSAFVSPKPQQKATKITGSSPTPNRTPEGNSQSSKYRNETNRQINKVVSKESLVHHTFDIYDEQLLELKKLKLEKHRDKITISFMVRDALDQYINKEKNK